jgi:hypothetical protein
MRRGDKEPPPNNITWQNLKIDLHKSRAITLYNFKLKVSKNLITTPSLNDGRPGSVSVRETQFSKDNYLGAERVDCK